MSNDNALHQTSPHRVTVIGLGAMGLALAAAFLKNGHPTTVWNRTAEKADALVAKGARRVATVGEAVLASPVVVVCVLDYGVVREILAPVGSALSGRAIVNLTNGTPQQARETAQWVAAQGAGYLDGGIMATPPMIGEPHALVLYSGSAATFQAYEKTLKLLGAGRYLGSDPGLGSLHDLALLSGMYGLFAGFFHSVALVGTENVKAMEFMTLLGPWLEAVITFLPGLARQIDAGDYTIDVVSNLGMQAVSFENIVQASKGQGISTSLITPLQTLFQQRVAGGHGAQDISGVIELIRNPKSSELAAS
jgi:3-hydroxyisobutyrate dehydrogenase-like beta-hydroxyacid dehydrogenase